MFTEYFAEKGRELQEKLKEQIQKRGLELPAKEKDLRIYRDLFHFIRDHIPQGFSLASGRVRNKRHMLSRSCDMVIYRKFCPSIIEMAGNFVLAESVHAFLSIETDLRSNHIVTHAGMTNAIKSLYADSQTDTAPGNFLPIFSLFFAYQSALPLLSHKKVLDNYAQDKAVAATHQTDIICVLDQGMIIKDWEAGRYKVIETGPDTLMWFFILLLEYLDRDGQMRFNPREYIKNTKTYNEYE